MAELHPEPPDGTDLEATKRWIEAAVQRELHGLEAAQGLQVNLSAYQAWLLLQLLQQGYHRLKGDARELARDLGRTIEEGYLAPGTVLRRFADLGWDHPPQRLHVQTADGVPDAYTRAFQE